MPSVFDVEFDLSQLNTVITIFGFFIIAYGAISVKIKQVWYLGEALPAVIFGILLGPMTARWLDSRKWGEAILGQQPAITLGMARLVIGVQLVIAGFQLPAQYARYRWKELMICLLPVMTIMWLSTTACMMATVPKISLLAGLVIGSCVTCTDPILSQAVAKGPFSDKYVRRNLREIISAEAGANDGFGFPFLMLAVYLIRFSSSADVKAEVAAAEEGNGLAERAVALGGRALGLLFTRAEEGEGVGRLGGGVGQALATWTVTTWLYVVIMSVLYGAAAGLFMMVVGKFCLRRKWIDSESYLLIPTALGLWLLGTAGILGTDDLLACFVAGNALNWNGEFLRETERKHDEYNSIIDVLLNFGGFMYIGTVIPFRDFQDPDGTGLTVPRLLALGVLVIIFRRIPAIFITYKLMPKCVTDWKEALFMGYFGPIGIGAVFYVEHTRHLFPEAGTALTEEENNLTRVMIPVVYWLVLFSIVWHGLSIPALNLFYKWRGVRPITDEDGPTEVTYLSENDPLPKNYVAGSSDLKRRSILVNNRFSRAYNTAELDLKAVENYRRRTQQWENVQMKLDDAEKQQQGGVQWASPHYRDPAMIRKSRIDKVFLEGDKEKVAAEGGKPF